MGVAVSRPSLMDATSSDVDLFSLSYTAIIGLMGFVLFELGYESNTSSVRSCVLSSSPRQDHASLLALALGMGALGGCVTCGCGLIDLAPLLYADSGSLPAQTTVQLLICAVFVIVGMVSTIATCKYTAARLGDVEYVPLKVFNSGGGEFLGYGTVTEANDSQYRQKGLSSSPHGATEVNGSAVATNDELSQAQDSVRSDSPDKDSTCVQQESSLNKNCCSHNKQESNLSDNRIHPSPVSSVMSESWTGLPSAITPKLSCRSSTTSGWSECPETPPHTPRRRGCDKRILNMTIVALSLFMGSSVLYSFNAYVSDFLGRSLFGGNPYAAKGSAELNAYEEGVSLASSGLLIDFCCYFVVSMLQDRLLRRLGAKLNFCLAHVMMAGIILTMTLVKDLVWYYVACVLYGFQRSALLTIPFVLANRYAQEKTSSDRESSVGKAMAAMSCMLPLYFCTFYLLSGPLIQLTGYDARPLLVAVGFSILAALTFMLHGVLG